MNVNNNQLIDLAKYKPSSLEGFIEVPKSLQQEAMNELDGKESVKIPMDSKSKLNRWAERIRQKALKNNNL